MSLLPATSIKVFAVNPIATTDNYTATGTTPVTLTPLTGDTAAATIKSINAIDLTPATAQSIPVPNGVVNISTTGVITFTATAGYSGTVTFPYIIQNDLGETGTANQVITVASSTPSPNISTTKTVDKVAAQIGETLTYTLVHENIGTVDASGSTVKDVFPAAIDINSITCVATGGAVCPTVNPTAAQLAAGQVVTTFPVGGKLTYTVNTLVTGNSTPQYINWASFTKGSATGTIGGITVNATSTILTPTCMTSFTGINRINTTTVAAAASNGRGYLPTLYSPETTPSTVWLGLDVDQANCPANNGNQVKVTLNFSEPIKDPTVHMMNVDAAQLVFDAPFSATKISGNQYFEVSPDGRTFNAVPGVATWGGCGNGSNDTIAGCGSALASGFYSSMSFFLNDTTPRSGSGDGFYMTISTVPLAKIAENCSEITNPLGQTDVAPLDNKSCVTTQIGLNYADTKASKTVDKATAVGGDILTYNVNYENSGIASADGATIQETLPTGLTSPTVVSCVPTGGAVCPATLPTISQLAAGVVINTFPSGGKLTFVITGTVPAGFIGSLTNTAEISNPPGLVDTSLENNKGTAETIIVPSPNIELLKFASSLTDTNGDTVAGGLGDTISYTFTVKNTGNVALTNITLTDINATVVGGPIATLAVGATDTTTFTATHTITAAEVSAGKVENSATATGTPPNKPDGTPGTPVTDVSDSTDPTKPGLNDPTVTPIPASPKISVDKKSTFNDENLDTYAQVGETIKYDFIIRNTGNVTLTNVTITDPLVGIVITGGPIASLAPGATDSTTITAIYTIKQSDITAGKVVNQATVNGTPNKPDGTPGTPVSDISNDPKTPPTNPLDPNDPLAKDPTITKLTPPTNGGPTIIINPNTKVADLKVIKTGSKVKTGIGETLTYTIEVINNGPDAPIGATLVDSLPAGYNPTSFNCLASSGAICPSNLNASSFGSGINIDLNNGDKLIFTIDGTVSTTDQLTNTAKISLPPSISDPNLDNNQSSFQTNQDNNLQSDIIKFVSTPAVVAMENVTDFAAETIRTGGASISNYFIGIVVVLMVIFWIGTVARKSQE